MPDIKFSLLAFLQYVDIQDGDKKTQKKLNALLKDIGRHPRSGIGQVECLKGKGGDVYSRRLNQKDRVVYTIEDDGSARIQSIIGHYDDK